MDALAFLERVGKSKPRPVYVLSGDEDFLKRQALTAIRGLIFEGADPAFAVSSFAGDRSDWSVVRGELDTLPFLSPYRLVVIEQADPFVTKHRATLEKYVAGPANRGILVLEVKTWPANTKLAKQVPDDATVGCKSLATQRLTAWCGRWAQDRYGKQLAAHAAGWLVELVGSEMGVLDQELQKLAVAVGDAKSITQADIDRLVGRSRSAETFKIFDAIGAGKPADALALLARLFEQGDEPMQILGAVSWQMRRLAQVSRLVRLGQSISAAMDVAGVPPFARAGIEQQLRHLGRARMDQIYEWLVETDLALKGSSPLPPRVVLERLMVRLARPQPAPRAATVSR